MPRALVDPTKGKNREASAVAAFYFRQFHFLRSITLVRIRNGALVKRAHAREYNSSAAIPLDRIESRFSRRLSLPPRDRASTWSYYSARGVLAFAFIARVNGGDNNDRNLYGCTKYSARL